MKFCVLSAVLFIFAIEQTFACNGYKAKLKKIKSCASENVISVDDGFTMKLSKKCELIPNGCFSVKGFSKAKASYSVLKDGMPMKSGTVDLCEAAADVPSEGKNLMKIFALPDHCPVAEGKICANENTKADLSKYKHMLAMARGEITLNGTIKHDTGVTCYSFELEITK